MKAKLDQIETFVIVTQLGHFAKAAKVLQVTPAAVSKKISELEKQLQVKLLHRTTRLCQLTEVGERYYQQWLAILEQINQTEEFITHLQETPDGKLYVVTPRKENILPYLAGFQKKYPKISLKIEIAEKIPDFTKDKIDIALGMSFEPPEDIVRKKIGQTRYILVGSPAYFAKNPQPLTPNDLSQHFYIEQYNRPQAGWIPFDTQQKVYCAPSLLLNNTYAMVECAAKNLGIARVHEYVAAELIVKKQLITVLDDYLQTPIPIYIYYAYSQYVEPKIRCFVDYFADKLKF